MPLPPSGRSVLQTEEPLHIPGYSGYVPQLAYKCGQSFSPSTHSLLINPNVDKSGNSVLAHTSSGSSGYRDLLHEQRKEIMKSRTASWGDQKLTHPMVPGYTGSIPRLQNYNGQTYANASFNAITEFENAQRLQKRKVKQLQGINCLQSGSLLPDSLQNIDLPPLQTRTRMPLRKVRRDMADYHSPNLFTPKLNVYKLPNIDEDKRFIAGYMGFVPRTHELFGKDYKNITHTGLNLFTDGLQNRRKVLSTPVQINKPAVRCENIPEIYRQDGGLVPKYTGHVPGRKYRFGRTFWESSLGAKDRFSTKHRHWTSQQKAVGV